jgi:hypothetical protein
MNAIAASLYCERFELGFVRVRMEMLLNIWSRR